MPGLHHETFFIIMELKLHHCGPAAAHEPLSIPQMIPEYIWSISGMIWTDQRQRTQRHTCPSATLFTINHTWAALTVNPVYCNGNLVINGLWYSMANIFVTKWISAQEQDSL
jgi:hypothetical protein